jgi:hypothetical protein
MYLNKQNNIDIVYAILHSIQRSFFEINFDELDINLNIKRSSNDYEEIQLSHILYQNKSLWELRALSFDKDGDFSRFSKPEVALENEVSSEREPIHVDTKINLKVYTPEKFAKIWEMEGISKNDIKRALAETKNREQAFKAGQGSG